MQRSGRHRAASRARRSRAATIAAAVVVFSAAVIAVSYRQPPREQTIAPGSAPAIRVSQVGYLPGAPKVAMLVGDAPAGTTAAIRRPGGSTVARVPMAGPRAESQSGDRIHTIDFTQITTPGQYVISVDGAGESDPVHVGTGLYRGPLYLALRSFYGQRCGTAVDLGPNFPGYRYDACHLQDAVFHGSSGKTGRRPATRGWHDAGDYGKYIVNSGISTGELLWAWEWYPSLFRDLRLDIPESGDRLPDLLDEVRWNLDWMLAMQDEDGGVWHKLTSERFGSFVMPHADDGGTRYVIGTGAEPFKSSCATADLAAVAAIASRAWREFDQAFAIRTLSAARRAWDWVEKNPAVVFRNPRGVQTGEYGDSDCSDERLWAAAELLRTTGEPAFERAARALAGAHHVSATQPQWWQRVSNMGLWAYAMADPKAADGAVQQRIRAETIDAARTIVRRTNDSGWRHGLTVENFVWGSNGIAADYGVLLLAAERLSGDRSFRDAALDHVHYLLGRNTFGVSWLTGVGVRPFRHPHHRPSGADRNELPWPGLLSGGPNRNGGDPALDKIPAAPPARRYVDEQASYASNENAINWNAALVLLLAGVQKY